MVNNSIISLTLRKAATNNNPLSLPLNSTTRLKSYAPKQIDRVKFQGPDHNAPSKGNESLPLAKSTLNHQSPLNFPAYIENIHRNVANHQSFSDHQLFLIYPGEWAKDEEGRWELKPTDQSLHSEFLKIIESHLGSNNFKVEKRMPYQEKKQVNLSGGTKSDAIIIRYPKDTTTPT